MKAITEARLRSVELGLTPTGMLKNRWRIKADDVAEKREARPAKKPRRLKVVDGAVFWPAEGEPFFELTGVFPFPSSGHRLVWVDVKIPGR